MPLAIVLMAINIAFVIHAAKTGRFNPWGYVILLLPGVGALAYVLVELIPEWMGTHQGQQARRRVVNALDPEKQYRKLSDDLAIADTIATRACHDGSRPWGTGAKLWIRPFRVNKISPKTNAYTTYPSWPPNNPKSPLR